MDTVSSNECVSSSTGLRTEKKQSTASFNNYWNIMRMIIVSLYTLVCYNARYMYMQADGMVSSANISLV